MFHHCLLCKFIELNILFFSYALGLVEIEKNIILINTVLKTCRKIGVWFEKEMFDVVKFYKTACAKGDVFLSSHNLCVILIL